MDFIQIIKEKARALKNRGEVRFQRCVPYHTEMGITDSITSRA